VACATGGSAEHPRRGAPDRRRYVRCNPATSVSSVTTSGGSRWKSVTVATVSTTASSVNAVPLASSTPEITSRRPAGSAPAGASSRTGFVLPPIVGGARRSAIDLPSRFLASGRPLPTSTLLNSLPLPLAHILLPV